MASPDDLTIEQPADAAFDLDAPDSIPDALPTEQVGGLKNAAVAERQARKAAEQELQRLREQLKGVDPEKYRKLEEEARKAAELQETLTKVQLETEARLKADYEQQKRLLEEAVASERKKRLEGMKRQHLQRDFVALGGNGDPDVFDAFCASFASTFGFEETDDGGVLFYKPGGKYEYVIDEATGKSRPKTPRDKLAELKDTAKGSIFFKAPKAGGTGSYSLDSAMANVDPSKLSTTEKWSFGLGGKR